MWSLALLGIRLTLAQAFGIVLSMCGVLAILLHGDLTTLKNIEFNRGDLIFLLALLIFGFYGVLTLKRPADARPVIRRLHLRLRRAACLIPLLPSGSSSDATPDAARRRRTC